MNRIKEKERKERTRRLIQHGALFDHHYQCEGWEPERLKKYLDFLENNTSFPSLLDQSKKDFLEQEDK